MSSVETKVDYYEVGKRGDGDTVLLIFTHGSEEG